MNQPLHVLILEDSPDDAELIVLALEDGGYTPVWERVDSAQAMRLALDRQAWDIIIADHSMPHFSVPKALELLKERGNHIPLIMVSGAVGDETAARIMRAGARDFIAKSNLARLVPSLRREMNEVRAEREHRRIQAELESLRHRNELILRAIGEGVCGLDEHGRIAFINPAAAAMLGYAMNELLGQLLSNFLHIPRPSVGRGIGPLLGLQTQDMQTRDVQTTLCEGLLRRKDGSAFIVEYTATLMPERHEIISAVLVFRDISERKQNEARIQYLAHHDVLTGLANRLLLNEQLQQAISSAIRHQRIGAVLLLDIDGFKNINDTQGHQAGDTLLKKIGLRLQTCLRDEDMLARLGGDEFIIVLSEVAQAEMVSGIAQKVLDCFKQPFDLGECQVSLATSLGITLYPADAIYPDQLLRNADIAMYRAKRQGGNAYRFYTEQMNTEAIQRAAL
ncbi:MAG: diguanylate cyclase, partial [Gallionellaceae bacterium]|nr:diguanylate cyclase [Gallionellaceae bacterium]